MCDLTSTTLGKARIKTDSDKDISQINQLQLSLIEVFDQKISVKDWCASHRQSNINNINDKLFPITDCSFYKEIAKYLISINNKFIMKLPDDMDISRSNMTYYLMSKQQCIDIIKGSKWENSIIDSMDQRISISNEQALIDLINEIDSNIIIHDLFWLLSWSLRLTFVTSSILWEQYVINENLDIMNTARLFYHTHAYKNRKLFDQMIRHIPAHICQKLMSFDVLNNTFLTKKGLNPNIQNVRDIMVRLIPWPTSMHHVLTENDILDLWSCGIFPLGTMLHGMADIDSFPMSGPMLWLHDLTHTTSYISSSMVFLSKHKFNQPLVDQIINSMYFWWNQYNIMFMNIMDEMNSNIFWDKNQKHILFLFVHEHFGSAMEKCLWIMERKMDKILVLNQDQVNFRHDMTPGSPNFYKKYPLHYGEIFNFALHLNMSMNQLLSQSKSYPKNLMEIQTQTFLFNKLTMDPSKSESQNDIYFCNSPQQIPQKKIQIIQMPPLEYHSNLNGLLLSYKFDARDDQTILFFEIELIPYTNETIKWKITPNSKSKSDIESSNNGQKKRKH